MFYEDYISAQNQYAKGIFQIKQDTYNPKVEIQNEPALHMNKVSLSFRFTFSREGNLLEKIEESSKGKSRLQFFYNNSNQLIRIVKSELYSNKLLGETTLSYNCNNKVELETYTEYESYNSVKIEQQIHNYSENIDTIRYTSDSDFFENGTYTVCYDNKNRIIEEKLERDIDGIVYWNKFEFDDKANTIKTFDINEDSGKTELCYLETLNEKNIEISYECFEGKGWKKQFHHEYDKNGNWVQMHSFIDDTLQYHIIREITYYE